MEGGREVGHHSADTDFDGGGGGGSLWYGLVSVGRNYKIKA